MPYDAKDPRASLTPGPAVDKTPTDFAGTEYVKFYETPPDEDFSRRQDVVCPWTELNHRLHRGFGGYDLLAVRAT